MGLLRTLTSGSRHRKLLYILLAALLVLFFYLLSITPHTPNPVETSDNTVQESKPQENLKFESSKPAIKAKTFHRIWKEDKVSFSGPGNRFQEEIVNAFMHGWKNYKSYAWGRDELKPLSKGWLNWMGLGLTIVDSLDTLWIMDLKNEFQVARDWVANNLTFALDTNVQMFEVIIRELGGLLSAYRLSGDEAFLTKALQLGNALLPCFKAKNKVPCQRIGLLRSHPAFGDISTAEAGTIQLELRELGRASKIEEFETVANDISDFLHQLEKYDGLVATFIGGDAKFKNTASISVGASADSYYEYLLKQWIQTGKTNDWLKNDYMKAVDGIKKYLVQYTSKRHLAFVGSYTSWKSKYFRAEMEHLACFLPGTLALGVLHGLDKSHQELAANLTATCYAMYETMETGLSPEIVGFGTKPEDGNDIIYLFNHPNNMQRPETVESLYYMYLLTHDAKYRDWGWKIFQSFEKYSRVPGGYACLANVNSKSGSHQDKMESFFLAETLKYLYLLFDDSPGGVFPVDSFVFNTEAHPLPIYDS